MLVCAFKQEEALKKTPSVWLWNPREGSFEALIFMETGTPKVKTTFGSCHLPFLQTIVVAQLVYIFPLGLISLPAFLWEKLNGKMQFTSLKHSFITFYKIFCLSLWLSLKYRWICVFTDSLMGKRITNSQWSWKYPITVILVSRSVI